MHFRHLILALAMLAVGEAQAAPQRDNATGLSVNPPAGYIAETLPAAGGMTARFAVRRPSETDTGCQIGYSPAPQNARLTQAQINVMMGSSAWQDSAKAALAPLYDISIATMTERAGLRGLMLVADLKPRPGLPASAQDIRSYFSIIETPKGRTTIVCVGHKAEFGARQPEFDAIATSTIAP
jgi:hypothetical protein